MMRAAVLVSAVMLAAAPALAEDKTTLTDFERAALDACREWVSSDLETVPHRTKFSRVTFVDLGDRFLFTMAMDGPNAFGTEVRTYFSCGAITKANVYGSKPGGMAKTWYPLPRHNAMEFFNKPGSQEVPSLVGVIVEPEQGKAATKPAKMATSR